MVSLSWRRSTPGKRKRPPGTLKAGAPTVSAVALDGREGTVDTDAKGGKDCPSWPNEAEPRIAVITGTYSHGFHQHVDPLQVSDCQKPLSVRTIWPAGRRPVRFARNRLRCPPRYRRLTPNLWRPRPRGQSHRETCRAKPPSRQSILPARFAMKNSSCRANLGARRRLPQMHQAHQRPPAKVDKPRTGARAKGPARPAP